MKLFKWLKSFHKTLYNVEYDENHCLPWFIYGFIVFLPSFIIGYGLEKINENISNVMAIICMTGLVMLLIGVWRIVKDDIKHFFKKVNQNK